ncbi:MAG: DUF4838 domain-containing protein [Bacteroidales bacterium]|nr:DUF4838 domain-containing protein [Bacteroidales bacterium]
MFRSASHFRIFLAVVASVVSMSLCCSSCSSSEAREAEVKFYIFPSNGTSAMDVQMCNFLKTHLQRRCNSDILSNKFGPGVRSIEIHIGNDIDCDYQVKYTESGFKLSAADERTMTWLCYQFIKHLGHTTSMEIATDDLPPCIFPQKNQSVRLPFEYRDIHMPSNQSLDMTQVLCLHNLENDWGLWGHQMAKVLGIYDMELLSDYNNLDPEFFARIGGMTYKDQFCFSSERLYDATERFIIDQYGEDPHQTLRLTIGPNDNGIVCQCNQCVLAGNTPKNATPAVVAFIERLANRFPKIEFFIPGYSTTYELPNHILPLNVGVFLSAIDYPRIYGNSDSPEAKAFFDRLEQWKRIAGKVYIWDYICNFDDYLSPYPILLVMQERLQQYRDRGVKGIFLNGSGYFYSNLQEAYTFVLSELLLDPDQNASKLIQTYFRDAMPHQGNFFATMFVGMERHNADIKKELPLYGGIEEALSSYLAEDDFRRYYDVMLQANQEEMTYREKVIYNKTKQIISLSYMEICRYHGLGAGGFASQVDGKWEPKAEVMRALSELDEITPEEDLVVLTGNENAAMDHMDRVNEEGVYIADYENECKLWLEGRSWDDNMILGVPVTLRRGEFTEVTNRLSDGVTGISKNYHWGWQIVPQKNLVIEIPVDPIRGAHDYTMTFLNFKKHNMTPPLEIEIVVDGKPAGKMTKMVATDYFDEGEKVTFHGRSVLSPLNSLQLVISPSASATVAIDEIFVRK